MPPIADFKQVGQCGLWMSDLMPHLATKVDELCWLRSMVTDSPAHPGAIRLFQTGSLQFVRPSMGSWIMYGLGTENQNLPGFVVISPMLYGDDGSPLHYSNVFLPAIYQGTRLGDARTPVKNSKIGYLGDPSLAVSAAAAAPGPDPGPQPDGPGDWPAGSEHRRADPVVRARLPDADAGSGSLRRDARVGGDAPSSTASATKPPTISAGSASWRGVWPKPASATFK